MRRPVRRTARRARPVPRLKSGVRGQSGRLLPTPRGRPDRQRHQVPPAWAGAHRRAAHPRRPSRALPVLLSDLNMLVFTRRPGTDQHRVRPSAGRSRAKPRQRAARCRSIRSHRGVPSLSRTPASLPVITRRLPVLRASKPTRSHCAAAQNGGLVRRLGKWPGYGMSSVTVPGLGPRVLPRALGQDAAVVQACRSAAHARAWPAAHAG